MGTSKPNKIKYGLSNVFYAKLLNEVTNIYSTPVKIEGAVNLSLSQTGDTTAIYADNVEYFSLNRNGGYAGNIEFVMLPDTVKVDLLGEILDTNGIQIENSNASTAYFALFFQFEGDVKNKRHVLYRCRCTRPNIESSTKADRTENRNETLAITVLPRIKDKKIKAFSTVDADVSIYDRWYTGVYPDLIPTLTITSIAGLSEGDTKITVTEAKGEGNTYVYKTDETVEFPATGAVCAVADGWTAWDGTADMTATTGYKILVVEIDSTEKAVRAGSATVTSKAGV